MTFKLDRRTRRDEDRREDVQPHAFFAHELPDRLAQNGALAAAAAAHFRTRPLTIEACGETWSLVPSGQTIAVVAGAAEEALVVSLSARQFSDWVQNQLTFNGMMVARDLAYRGGSLRDISTWDSLWIAILEGWPVVDPALTFRDAAGEPLAIGRTFGPSDAPEDIAHFLREAGFVHLRGWIAPDLVAAISREMDAARDGYVEGDGKSWWAEVADGSRLCVRLQEFVERSPTTKALLKSESWERLTRILEGNDELARKPVEGRIIEALFKPVGVVSGPSDLPFHRDCHLGRHSYACARMTIGIAITPSNAQNGQLRVIAGSHRLAMPVEVAKTEPYLPLVALSTEPGDVTVHLSCTLHEATAPISCERRVMYTEIPLAGHLIEHVGGRVARARERPDPRIPTVTTRRQAMVLPLPSGAQRLAAITRLANQERQG
ncbi:phytanoyl-CoA dioxygenase family protein [Novosphingobium sp. BL-8H]|uniref:phytanoyl-CoA dioxygenase family protein n=1 Tax=Novosphingobium sp. BL-8H TaxID=3127640 RepID=UPI003756D4B8